MAKRTTRRSRPAPDPADAIVDATLRLAGERGWRGLSMAEIADAAGLSLSEVHRHYRCKAQILCAFMARIDRQVLDGTDPEIAAEPVRDRLFDLVMRRLDALKPYKPGVQALARALMRRPPAAALVAAGPLMASLQWMLTAARIEPWGPLQPLQLKGFALIYLSVLRVWLADDGEDQAKTMAALDKALRRADALVGRFRPGRRREAAETA
jgi:AcrR family transcriptional regulator